MDFDVVVVGSGGAALAAAVSAATGGAKVVVLERAPVFGGTTAISGAGMWLPLNPVGREMGYEDSPEEVREYLGQLAVGRTSERLLDAFVANSSNAYDFLATETSIEFEATTNPDYQMGLAGAKAGGRSIWPSIFDGRRLGELLPLVRDTPSPGGMPPVLMKELADSNWGLGEGGDAWAALADGRRRDDQLGKGRALIGALLEACVNRNVELVASTRVVGLVTGDAGNVIGVEALRDGSTVTYGAKEGVVLASGGFEWNNEMWRELVGVPLDSPVSPPGNEGDALRMAMRAGARVGNLSEIWWMPGIAVPGESYDGRPRLRMGAAGKSLPGAIVVNQTGRRFANESMNYNDFGKYMVQFDPQTYSFPNYPAFVVHDNVHRTKYPPIAYDADRHRDSEWLVEAPTLKQLAEKLGIDPRGLEEQVAQFNADAERGDDTAFKRGSLAYDSSTKFGDRSLKNPNLRPLTEPPFYGYRLAVSCLGTKGGPVINEHGQVVGYDDKPIQGLYAAGNAACAVFGTAYPGGGATIGAGVTFGYIAGKALTGSPAAV
jgi:succinate dehydrogenase/fumarate reductase flavoprotein subunit